MPSTRLDSWFAGSVPIDNSGGAALGLAGIGVNACNLRVTQDELGRVCIPRAQREAILDQFEASGMSGAAFAAHIGVKYPTFAFWVQKRRRERGELPGGLRAGSGQREAGGCQWIEVVAGATGGRRPALVVVQLPGGARMEVSDAAGASLAAELLTKLAGVRGC